MDEAAKGLGWEETPVHVVDNLDDTLALLKAECDENTCREPFTPSEAATIGQAIEEMLRPKQEAKEKAGKSADGKAGGWGKGKPSGKLPEGLPDEPTRHERETRTQAAQAAGMSPRTYEKAKAVVEAAWATPASK